MKETKRIKLPPADCYKFPNRGYVSAKKMYQEYMAHKGTKSHSTLRIKLLKQQNFKCAYCGDDLSGRQAHIEHILAISKRGTNEVKNLVMACPDCNKDKEARFLKKRLRQAVKQNARAGVPERIPYRKPKS